MDAYPKPKETGGRLIRQVISGLRVAEAPLPISSHILCAVSGGLDSIALAHLLAKYGRRVGGQIAILHINHHWRGEQSNADARFVEAFARDRELEFLRFDLSPPQARPGQSLEDLARQGRKQIFEQVARERPGALVFTAHHADDVAETMVWRLFTGAADTHGGGILRRHGHEVRPLLEVRKAALEAFLREEDVEWREDTSNQNTRFLRNQVRHELMPVIERIFPRAVERLVEAALKAQGPRLEANHSTKSADSLDPLIQAVFSAQTNVIGQRLKRAHIENIGRIQERADESHSVEITLPGGWTLNRTKTAAKMTRQKP
ncbi:MAG: tRNA lysidine(34) synthetase TilS [Bacteriovoracia bacterium]